MLTRVKELCRLAVVAGVVSTTGGGTGWSAQSELAAFEVVSVKDTGPRQVHSRDRSEVWVLPEKPPRVFRPTRVVPAYSPKYFAGGVRT
jgi:hypothetical protein